MTRLLHAELLKATTTRILLWLALLIVGLIVLLVSLTAASNPADELAQPGHQRDLVSFAAVSALIALILGIIISAGEFAHGTIGQTFLVAPAREMSMMVGALFGMLILGERVTAWRVTGCAILIGGVVLLGSAKA